MDVGDSVGGNSLGADAQPAKARSGKVFNPIPKARKKSARLLLLSAKANNVAPIAPTTAGAGSNESLNGG